jgi:hypothetical protein
MILWCRVCLSIETLIDSKFEEQSDLWIVTGGEKMTENNSTYSKLQAAGHQRELEITTDFLKDIESGVSDYFFLNFFAPDSYGKTYLLERIWNKHERGTPVSFVRVRSFLENNKVCNLCDMLIYMMNEFSFRLPKRIADLPQGFENSEDKEWLAEWVVKLVSTAAEVGKGTLLLLDDYDDMPLESRRWFEDKVLIHFAKTKRTGVILTSALELRFTGRIVFRMRKYSYELSSLSTEAITRSFPEYEAFASEIHRMTGGLPRLMGELVEQLKTSEVTTVDEFRSRQEELTKKYYGTYVGDIVFQDVPQNMRKTIQVLSLFRRFDVLVLNGILPKVLPEYYHDYGTADYLDLIEHLGSRIQWRMQGGYALNEAVGMVLRGYVFFEEPKLFEKVNRAAVLLYRSLLNEEYREYYLVELLFHGLELLRVHDGSDLTPIHSRIELELMEYLNGEIAIQVREADLDSLRNTLMKDPDLKDYISEDVLNAIKSMIDARILEVRVLPFNTATG